MHTPFRALKEIYNPYAPYMPYKDRYDIQQQPEINASLGAVDRSEANLEAERGEVAVKPDLSGIYHIGGKKHSQGGTPLNLDPGAFIFSNDPSLRITPQEKEVFKFKMGGTTKRENTPARVLKREVNLSGYNRSANIAQDRDHENDDISKRSAQLMLEKYQGKMGKVAYLQESKKGFPTGIPSFSQGTAPVMNSDVENKIEQNTQYMRAGGFTNPYTPQMMRFDEGGDWPPPIKPSDAYPGGSTRAGRMTPKGIANNFNYAGGVDQLVSDWKKVGVDLGPLNTRDAQDAMYQWAMKNNPNLVQSMWEKYGNTAQGKQYGLNYDTNALSSQQLSRMGDAFDDGDLGARTFGPSLPATKPNNPLSFLKTVNPSTPGAPIGYNPPNANGMQPNPFGSSTTLPYNPRVPLSPLQKANLLYSGYQAMSVPRYNPSRSQVKSPLVELTQYNQEPALNAVRSAASQAYQNNRVQNPYLSGVNNQGIFGKSLEAQQGVIGDYANRNVGVANQQAMTNSQLQREDLMFNTQASQRYYDQTQALAQNYNNEKRAATNQTVSLANNYLSQNQALEQMLASQRTYGRTRVGTNPDGSPVYQAKPLYDVDFSGISPHVYYTGAGSLSGIPYMSNRLYDFQLFSQEMRNAGIDPNSVVGARYYAATKGQPLQSQYNYQPSGAPPSYKKGGTFSWMQAMYRNPYMHRQ